MSIINGTPAADDLPGTAVELTLGSSSDRVGSEGLARLTIIDFEAGEGGDWLDIQI